MFSDGCRAGVDEGRKVEEGRSEGGFSRRLCSPSSLINSASSKSELVHKRHTEISRIRGAKTPELSLIDGAVGFESGLIWTAGTNKSYVISEYLPMFERCQSVEEGLVAHR